MGGLGGRLSSLKEYNIEVMLISPSKNKKGAMSIVNDISHEMAQIRRYVGNKMVLQRNLSEILGVNASKLEIGYIDTDDTLNGCKIHIIHKVASMEGDITKLYDGKYEIL